MPKAKPVSLHPLSFDEAINAILGATTNSIRKGPKKQLSAQKKIK